MENIRLSDEEISTLIYMKVFGDRSLHTDSEVFKNAEILSDAMSFDGKSNVSDTLEGMIKSGPLYDGDVPSKVERDILLSGGYCSKVFVGGRDGYNACTYKGGTLHLCLKEKYRLRRFRLAI